jgi:hypothetical protein
VIEVKDTVQVEAFDITGRTDEYAHAALSDEGIFIDPTFLEGVGIRWVDLANLLEHPYVQEQLEQVKMETGS